MTTYSHCQTCSDKLEHTALFCSKCGHSTCSWECYVRHLAEHQHEPQRAAREMRMEAATNVYAREQR